MQRRFDHTLHMVLRMGLSQTVNTKSVTGARGSGALAEFAIRDELRAVDRSDDRAHGERRGCQRDLCVRLAEF